MEHTKGSQLQLQLSLSSGISLIYLYIIADAFKSIGCFVFTLSRKRNRNTIYFFKNYFLFLECRLVFIYHLFNRLFFILRGLNLARGQNSNLKAIRPSRQINMQCFVGLPQRLFTSSEILSLSFYKMVEVES